jgi:hypothetical protein
MLENYKVDEFGVIKQKKIINKITDYNLNYIKNSYNSYGEKVNNISHLRLGYLIGAIGKINKLLDVGYGNGDFLKLASTFIENCYGNDISGYEIPNNCSFIDDIFKENFDVICFFDSLEHFDDINFIKNLKTTYIYISLPWCHYHSDEWFLNWKHRREDEHIYHFNDISLIKFMENCGFEKVSISNIEDIVRTPINNDFNILTGIFKKNDRSNRI